jgi:hypothetical protein
MTELKGRFYFRLTDNGNLIGEFSNNHSVHSQTESAERRPQNDIVPESPFGFIGTYQSTWFEAATDEPMSTRLKIAYKDDFHQIFTLQWIRPNCDKPLFEGEAMIAEGLLIGNYWMNWLPH